MFLYMKNVILLLCLLPLAGLSQSVLPLRADTVRIEKIGGSAELHLRKCNTRFIGRPYQYR